MLIRWVFITLIIIIGAACTSQPSGYTWSELKPQEIPDRARCPECGMYVKDYENWASQALLNNKEVVFFDDPGDLIIYYKKNKENIVKMYIRDYYSQKWVDAEKAFYVTSARIPTPMGFGIVPFEKKEDAEAFKKDYIAGNIVTFEELVSMEVSPG